VYIALILLQLFNKVASVLLYALLCIMYATLLGVVLYFCPKLLSLLLSSAVRHGALTTRLSLCSAVCVFVFAAHTVHYARLVVAPPFKVYWWWQYGTYQHTCPDGPRCCHGSLTMRPKLVHDKGALELIPTLVFLIIMRPNPNKAERMVNASMDSPFSQSRRSTDGLRRVDSDVRRSDEHASLAAITMSIGSVGGGQRRELALLSSEIALHEPPGYGSITTPADV
jgi:hypothetical protein